MKLVYWTNFSKRKNSTKQPSGGTEIDVVLKDNTSLLNPIFQTGNVPDNVNYCYVADFGRYYYVSGVSHDGPFCLIECECDVLATYKSQIGACSALVEFTSSSNNIKITDPRNHPIFETIEKYGDIFDLASIGFSKTGCYVLGIVSNGGVNYYAMTKAQLANLCQSLYDTSFGSQLASNFYDMKNCLVSCVWMPYTPTGGTPYTPIFIGNGAGEVGSGTLLDDTARIRSYPVGSKSFTRPSRDIISEDSYLDYAPYSEGSLYLPFVGVVPLDMDAYAEDGSFYTNISIDQYTGDIVYTLHRKAGDIISTYQGNFAVNVPLAGQSYNALGAASAGISLLGGVASAIGGAVSANGALLAGGLSGAAGAGLAMAQSMSKHTQTNGSLSSAVSAGLSMIIQYNVIMRKPINTSLRSYQASQGLPYYRVATISGLSGYVKCSNASVDIPGYPEEKDTVNGYVNGGFFYE